MRAEVYYVPAPGGELTFTLPLKVHARKGREHLSCPLCGSDGVATFSKAHRRCYFECHLCGLIFMAPEHRLSLTAEKARYEAHENAPPIPVIEHFSIAWPRRW